jgi:hypothetical protein
VSLHGLIVLESGGTPIYSKIVGINIKLDPALMGGFLTAIQTFAKEIDDTNESPIREMSLPNMRMMYRQFDYITFIGIIDPTSNPKASELILEYMIWAFLLKFKMTLKQDDLKELSQFSQFDTFFEQFRNSKEKDLQKWIEKKNSSKLQGILNKLTNYFPISEIVKINPKKLIIIGKKLIWVDFYITQEEEERIINELKKKTSEIYGMQIFETIEKEILKNMNLTLDVE